MCWNNIQQINTMKQSFKMYHEFRGNCIPMPSRLEKTDIDLSTAAKFSINFLHKTIFFLQE